MAIGMVVAALWNGYTHFSKKPDTSTNVKPVISIDGTIYVDKNGTQVISTGAGNVTVSNRDPQDKKIIETLLTKLTGTAQEVSNRDQFIKELEKTIKALRAKEDRPEAQEALAFLEKGDTLKAEQLFLKVLENKKKEGHKSFQEAAVAAQHIGLLAYLHDTQKALHAFGEAVKLDPNNALAWNLLGRLQQRIGDPKIAEKSYHTILELDKKIENQVWFAIAYGNLFTIYANWGDLDKALEMNNKSLAINKVTGNKKGIAAAYLNTGSIYQSRGDLDKATEMYIKSLGIKQTMGYMEGVTTIYGNLGKIYETKGDFDKAEEMYNKSISLFQEIGAQDMVVKTQSNLKNMR